MCLEEMFDQPVPAGALFYGETHRRLAITFDTDLRTLTARGAAEARANIHAGHTPPPIHTPACRRCSLLDLCQPERLEKPPSVARWLATQLGA